MSDPSVALSDRHIVSTILRHLSDMKYKDRRQNGPDEPVEFLEFRPTLVPAILVNRLWADEGINILWRRYPHLPALRWVSPARRQYYADKVQQVFVMSPPQGSVADLDYLAGLQWPNLKSLEFEVDFQRHGSIFAPMLHGSLEHLEWLGIQSGGSEYISNSALPELFKSCSGLKSVRIGHDVIAEDDPIHANAFLDLLNLVPGLNGIEVKGVNFMNKVTLFASLSQRAGLLNFEIYLDPGLDLLPMLSGLNALPSPFSSLKRLQLLCYPEIALALPTHLGLLEEFHVDLARIPDQPSQPADLAIIDNCLGQLLHCPHLRAIKIGVGLLAEDFPSVSSLPKLSGQSLAKLAAACPKLNDISIFTVEPFPIDGSTMSPQDFDDFCKALPQLRSLSLKLHPMTATTLTTTALQSLAAHCPELEVLRLKIPCDLTILHDTTDPSLSHFNNLPTIDSYNGADDPTSATTVLTSAQPIPASQHALFPKLTHLALSRPPTALCPTNAHNEPYTHSHTNPETSQAASSLSGPIPPTLEESLVRAHAHALQTHFPALEILEAWGDPTGLDNESLHYFLPLHEVLASTWEFLSGVEQDLWEDAHDDEDDEDDWYGGEYEGYGERYGGGAEEGDSSWATLDSGAEDWEKASLMNEFVDVVSGVKGLRVGDEPQVEMKSVMPGRLVVEKEIFTEADILDHAEC